MDGLFFLLIVILLIVGGTSISLRLYAHGGIWRRQRASSAVTESTTTTPTDYVGYETTHYARKIILMSAVILGTLIAIIISLINALFH